MLCRKREPIDYDALTAKYRHLKKHDPLRFQAKIDKFTARKNKWGAVLNAVNRYENFKDSEDDVPGLVQEQFAHYCCKYHTLIAVCDEDKEK